MTKNALTYAATITAYILGVATGILVVKELAERKYKKRSDDEIESVKSAFEERLKKRAERSAEESDKINEIYSKLLEQARYKAQEAPEEAENKENGPVVIPPEEFGDNPDYNTCAITYYESDGVFADEDDIPLEDSEVSDMFGVPILNHFGEYDDDRICVRNDAKRTYYEILREEGECEQ